jgi:hypothetical protein
MMVLMEKVIIPALLSTAVVVHDLQVRAPQVRAQLVQLQIG